MILDSKFGFCGTTSEFCGNAKVPEPACGGSSASSGRVIGYYEGWNLERSCDSKCSDMLPPGEDGDIPG